MRASVRSAMNQAYATRDPKRTRRLLDNLARRLESAHPGAAGSLRELLEETLTALLHVIDGFCGLCSDIHVSVEVGTAHAQGDLLAAAFPT
jgi:hypothetical protein